MEKFTATRNACKLCAPLGACIVFRGIKGAVPFLHGSQGCATYIRRYIISHFKEPMDIASSNFTEETAIFGGKQNLKLGLENVYLQYKPELIGIATTCLAETIGEDIDLILRGLKQEEFIPKEVRLVSVSTPSFQGTHIEGFRAAVKAVVESLVKSAELRQEVCSKRASVNLFPGFLSCEDLRHLKEILDDFNLSYVLLPDYSDTLDSGVWQEYKNIPEGGTSIEEIESMAGSIASIEFTRTVSDDETCAKLLSERFGIPYFKIGLPLGIKETDIFFNTLEKITGKPMPQKYKAQRARLVDSYVDSHKYLFEKKAVVYGEEDLAAALVSFLAEIGVVPVLCVSGGKSGLLKQAISEVAPEIKDRINVMDDTDFITLQEEAEKIGADFLIGNSKGYSVSRKIRIPLVRVGFPIHDRIGGARILDVSYRGSQQLFDRIVNALLSKKQEESGIGYSYM